MNSTEISVPAAGVVVVVARDPGSLMERGLLAGEVCDAGDAAERLQVQSRIVVGVGLGDVGSIKDLVAVAKRALVPITGLIDSTSLSGLQIEQIDKALANSGVASRANVGPDDRLVTVRLPFDRRDQTGPFDIIGDVHGCIDELRELLTELGYSEHDGAFSHPDGRCAVFVGDLTDRGPDSPAVLELVLAMHAAGSAMCVIGNHDDKLLRHLGGGNVKAAHGLDVTIEQLAAHPSGVELGERTRAYLADLPDHLMLDGGDLVVAHAGLKLGYHGKVSKGVRAFALYGETTGKTDADGFPERLDWASRYTGSAAVVHGHVVIDAAQWHNNVLDIDTGCVFGGSLTALRWPEREIVSIPARERYWAGAGDR